MILSINTSRGFGRFPKASVIACGCSPAKRNADFHGIAGDLFSSCFLTQKQKFWIKTDVCWTTLWCPPPKKKKKTNKKTKKKKKQEEEEEEPILTLSFSFLWASRVAGILLKKKNKTKQNKKNRCFPCTSYRSIPLYPNVLNSKLRLIKTIPQLHSYLSCVNLSA